MPLQQQYTVHVEQMGLYWLLLKRGKSGKVQIDAKVETTYNTRTYTPELVDGYTYANLMNEARTTRNKEAFFSDESYTYSATDWTKTYTPM